MSNKCREPGPGQLNWYHHGFNSKLLRASASPELAFVISTWTEPSVGRAVLVQKRGSVCPGLKVRQVRLLLVVPPPQASGSQLEGLGVNMGAAGTPGEQEAWGTHPTVLVVFSSDGWARRTLGI